MSQSDPLVYHLFESPVGPLTLVASRYGLRQVTFGLRIPETATKNPAHPVLADTTRQFVEYFTGVRTAFQVPLDMKGTPFQRQVWTLLQAVPYGATTTYGALARQLGDSDKARAVGLANAMNPVAIIVPCHRVVGASGALTGFAGGIDVKAFLLRHERTFRPAPRKGQMELFSGSVVLGKG